ncbi:CPBP family intramembrane glutamic endopeptidase [Salibacter halophilus]|uniref:CPBP family intramembrane metalloprotease n=1 Tax=Salibacter halophilus TaxID=1803916 RepID=A0A6N6M672_9FLAO|nr:CPBP family intramembrane glutamic endopeptidase [Salibacter halophilus]KAB1065107.1 CPBP family intramembrane metalloprotease [Salibacter halophilus]
MGEKKRIAAVILFYSIACAIAWPIFLNMSWFQSWLSPLGIPAVNPYLFIMWGPGVAALLSYTFFRKKIVRHVSLFGKQILRSLLFFLGPWFFFFFLHLAFPFSEQYKPVNFLLIIPISFVFTIGEELGWRGFLQDTLRPVPALWRWLTIGLLWEFWHIRFLWISETISEGMLRTLPLLAGSIALSFLLGYSTERSKSLLVPVTLHIWANNLMQSTHWVTFVTVGLSFILWFYLLKNWHKKLARQLEN